MDIPRNESVELYDPHKTSSTSYTDRDQLTLVDNACPPPGTSNYLATGSVGMRSGRKAKRKHRHRPPMRYSPGDRFKLMVDESPELTGDYAINIDGMVLLPYAGTIRATGLTNTQLLSRIERRLTRKNLFTAEGVQISVHPIQYAPINITVAGAVFVPGRHTINVVKDKEKTVEFRTKSGHNPLDRFVPAALQAAGGVRPDADVTRITVHRNGKSFKLNWLGAIVGRPVDDMPLIEGDHVEVHETGCFQSALMRPSQITPQGVRVFLSNLSVPALNNSNSVQNQNSSAGMPYGTRMLQALVQANCVGGTYTTNAKRYGVLISRNPKTRKTEVVQRAIEDLVRNSDRDAINPYLMPEDAIACYDSKVTEFRDVMAVLYGSVLPANGIRTLFAK